ncbi:LysR family transcriptional regulator [Jannaschia seohaensis]|uniref:DNA-binding transcriptional LysR family regulator n=1 Tax=Jannaschia seohaensis TaxID=475081 RepID=A0A2Y9AHY8_9RHOB|nr:LysR family transcriptional regulator [Jannaschia seohaensis]PWJ21381.1 DNA-binding transcriptional LysR family regulator [Jannaschia seohaensis]SSA41987.1 DNA-binding transcriptional regulator, LysR family [Jannaschia seohaensis]
MKNRFHDWGDARIFLAVAEQGSTLAASRVLGLAQTTVARRVDALERALGLRLFARDTRGFRLTAEGAALRPAAEDLRKAAGALEELARSQRTKARAPVRFTSWDDAINAELSDVFVSFVADMPGVSFEFMTSKRNLDLTADEADVALRLCARAPDSALVGRQVGRTEWTYYASEAYAAARGLPACYDDDLDDHTVVMLEHIPSARRNVLFFDSPSALVMAILTGRGIGPVPTIQGDRESRLVRCFPPPEGSEMEIWLLAGAAAYRRPEVKAFMAFAAPRFKAHFAGGEPRP